MEAIIIVLLAVAAGVCAGYSGLFQMRRPHPGWLLASGFAIWLFLIYQGSVTV